MARVDEFAGNGGKTPRDKGEARFEHASVVLQPYSPQQHEPSPEGRRPVEPPTLSRYDASRLQKLTPFAIPETATITRQAGGNLPPDSPAQWAREAYRNQAAARGVDVHTPTETITTEEPGKERTRRTYQLTWDEYNKLDDQQRAAVDFNTELVKAREKDLNANYTPTDQQKATYDEAVKQMFGPHGGSEAFAPETLAVLRQVDFKPEKGDDLDNYLGLKNAISANDLAHLTNLAEAPEVAHDFSADATSRLLTGHNSSGGTPAQRTAAGVTGLQEKLAATHQLLQNFKASARANRNEDLRFFGGTENKVHAADGFGELSAGHYENGSWVGSEKPRTQDWFHAYYGALTTPGSDVSALLGEAFAPLSPAERQDFMAYVDRQTSQADTFHLPLNGDKARGVSELRRLLGLDEGAKR